MNPFHCQLAGAATGSGGLCGSSFLNRIFEEYLKDKFKDYDGWHKTYMIDASKAFEARIKPGFTGDNEDPHIIRIGGLKPSKPHGVEKNFLTLTTKELREKVFDVVITKIQGLVRDQIANTDGRVKEVLLAGGFGKNRYLQKRLTEIESVVQNKIRIREIENRQVLWQY